MSDSLDIFINSFQKMLIEKMGIMMDEKLKEIKEDLKEVKEKLKEVKIITEQTLKKVKEPVEHRRVFR